MKDLVNYICESQKCMFEVVQYETDETGAYSTVNYAEGKKKYKHGWACINDDDEFVSITAINTATGLQDALGIDLKDCEELCDMKVLKSKEVTVNNGTIETWVKLW